MMFLSDHSLKYKKCKNWKKAEFSLIHLFENTIIGENVFIAECLLMTK